MLVTGFPAEAFGTNCYVVATAPGEQCVVIDPGIGVERQLDELLAKHRLQPAAVLLTHGHLDHTFSVAPVCKARGITAYVHPGDREMLADPAKGLSADLDPAFRRPADLHRAGRRRRTHRRPGDLDRGIGDHREPRTRPYQRVGDVPRARRTKANRCASAVTCCSRARSDAPTCRAATWRRCGRAFGTRSSRCPTRLSYCPAMARRRPLPRARDQPVPAGGGQRSRHRAKAGNDRSWQRRSRHSPASRSGFRRSA